jgi:DNA-binding NarL/FixJ family response regulator
MATIEKIYVGIDGERVELTGAELTAFKAQRAKDLAEAKAIQDQNEAKATARASALAKLASLGLTADEIASL